MMKTCYRILYIFLFTLFLGFFPSCSGQDSDNKSAIDNTENIARLPLIKGADMDFYHIYVSQRNANDPERAANAAETFLQHLDTLADNPILAEMASYIGNHYNEKSMFTKSIFWHDEALKIYIASGIIDSIPVEQVNLGAAYFKKNRYDLALKYILPAMKTYEARKDTIKTLTCYNLLGGIYYSCNDIETSLGYYRKLKANAKALNDTIQTVIANNNISLMATNQVDLKGTQELIKESIHLCAEVKDSIMYTKMMFCLTSLYVNSSDTENLEIILPEIIELESVMKRPFDIAQYHYNLGAVYNSLGRYKEAAQQLHSAIENYQKGEYLQFEAFCYGMLYDIYEKMGEKDLAYDMLLKFIRIKQNTDSIDSYIQLFRYQNELILQEEQKQLQEKKSEHQQMMISAIFVTIITIIIIFFLFQIKAGKIKEKEKELQNKVLEQEKKAQEIKNENEILELHRMQQFQLDSLIKNLISRLRQVGKKNPDIEKDIENICTDLKHSIENDGNWKELSQFVPEFNSAFFQNLLKDFPELTINERRLCALLNMNMTTKEISEVTKQTTHSINIARGRLRSKLGLTGSNTSIQEFLARYGQSEEL